MYNDRGDLAEDRRVDAYLPLVQRIAHHLAGRLPPNIGVDDLVQNGMIGLLDALRRGIDGPPAQFEAYVAQRVRGAMLDGLREMDWLPRTVRQDMRRVESAVRELSQKCGHPPSERDLADALAIPLEEYQALLSGAHGHQVIYLEDFSDDGDESFLDRNCGSSDGDPLAILADQDVRARLVRTIEDLPDRERLVMSLYYEEDLNLREIGVVLGVSESRACQLHAQAVARLRAKLFQSDQKPRRGRGPTR